MGNWGYFTLLIGAITLLITGRGPPCLIYTLCFKEGLWDWGWTSILERVSWKSVFWGQENFASSTNKNKLVPPGLCSRGMFGVILGPLNPTRFVDRQSRGKSPRNFLKFCGVNWLIEVYQVICVFKVQL